MDNKLKIQFAARSAEFDLSAKWITDPGLISAHTELAGKPQGKALDLCCGTGRIGRALKENGWNVRGLDICAEMARISSQHFCVLQAKAEKIPFADNSFHLVTCRQTFQFLNAAEALSEIRRVLVPGGNLILSLTVPFSDMDKAWLYEIHRIKQALLLKFYTADELQAALSVSGFGLLESRSLQVRESITKWMRYAPELPTEIKEKVITAIKDAPESYKKLHHVEEKGSQLMEEWNWVVLKAVSSKE
ncbi:MAG: class I SAM-dependent methyltransferase [Candidatus Omnitrophota bacterium]